MKEVSGVQVFDSWQFPLRREVVRNSFKKLLPILKEEDGFEALTNVPRIKERVKSRLFCKSETITFCGKELLDLFFEEFCEDRVEFEIKPHDGAQLKKGDDLLIIDSSMRDLFVFERPLLNLLMYLCGLATKAHEFSSLKKFPVFDTRKTLPGLRSLAKYASYSGGVKNHRWNLSEMIMIKDTHRLSYEDDLNALLHDVKRLETGNPICVEVENIADLKVSLKHHVEWIMIDNKKDQLDEFFEEIKKSDYQPVIEVSGNIDEKFFYSTDIPFVVSSSKVSFLPMQIDLSLKVFE